MTPPPILIVPVIGTCSGPVENGCSRSTAAACAGAISVAFLERIEELLAQSEGKDVRLGDAFDLVGGTSTGAIIAGALALGYSTAQVKDIYLRLAPFAFRPRWHIPVVQAKFDARGLRGQIDAIVGDRDLASHDLITGLGVITKRMDTGAPWILSNNPRAPYWNDGTDRNERGECPAPWEINSEIGTLAGDSPPGGKFFRFFRYDIQLEADWLASKLGLKVSDRDLARFRRIDDTAIVHEIYQIARIAAERQVKPEHWIEQRNPV